MASTIDTWIFSSVLKRREFHKEWAPWIYRPSDEDGPGIPSEIASEVLKAKAAGARTPHMTYCIYRIFVLIALSSSCFDHIFAIVDVVVLRLCRCLFLYSFHSLAFLSLSGFVSLSLLSCHASLSRLCLNSYLAGNDRVCHDRTRKLRRWMRWCGEGTSKSSHAMGWMRPLVSLSWISCDCESLWYVA